MNDLILSGSQKGEVLLQGDIWQFLEAFLTVTVWGEGLAVTGI